MADTNEPAKRKLTPRDVLRTAFRHRVLFALGTSLFAIVALFAIPSLSFFEKEYTGTAKFERHQEPTLNERNSSFEGFKSVLMHELAGRDAVRQVIRQDLELDRGLPRQVDGELTPRGQQQLQAMVEEFGKKTRVQWDVRTDQVDLVSVSFTHENPKLAEEVPNRLVTNYINRVSEEIVNRLKRSCDFLRERVDEVETRLAEAIRKRIEFEKENAGALPESPGGLEERTREIASDIDTLRLQHKIAKQKLERLKAMAEKTKAEPDEPVQVVRGPNPELARLKEELETREQELQGYKDTLQDYRIVHRMTDEHPKVQALKAKIASAEEKVAEIEKEIEETDEEVVTQRIFSTQQDREDLAVALAAAESECEMAEREIERLQNRLQTYEKHLAQYAPIREEWLRVTKRQEELGNEKDSWEQRLRDVEMSLTAEVAKRRNRLEQVQLAEKQHRPSSPTVPFLLAFALLGGLAFGVALVFLSNLTDRSVWTPHDAERQFGVPVCGTIGEIVPPQKRLWRAFRVPTEMTVLLLLMIAIGVGCLNVVLWLQYPDQYAQWTAAPLAYLGERTAELWAQIGSGP